MIAAVLVAIVVVAGLSSYRHTFPSPSYGEREALKAADTTARGFKPDDIGYSFTKLNKAVEYAQKNQCDNARAIYRETAKRPNGLKPIDLQAYEKRIEDICSGTEQPTTGTDEDY